MKEVFKKWDIFEFLTTEEAIDAFVKTAIELARDDESPSKHLVRELAIAAKAREMLNAKRKDEAEANANANANASFQEDYGNNPPVSVFDKVARSFGYHVALVPISAGE